MSRIVAVLIALALLSPLAAQEKKKEPPSVPAQALATMSKLNAPAAIDRTFDNPLRDLIDYLGEKFDVTIVINHSAFRSAGLEKLNEQPIKMGKLPNVSLGFYLNQLLSQVNGEYVVRGSALEITTKSAVVSEFHSNFARYVRFPSMNSDLRGGDPDPLSDNGLESSPLPLVHADSTDVPLETFVRSLSDQSGINVVYAKELPALKSKVSLRFTNQPVDQATYLAADMVGATSVRFRNTLYICEPETAKRLEADFDRMIQRQRGAKADAQVRVGK